MIMMVSLTNHYHQSPEKRISVLMSLFLMVHLIDLSVQFVPATYMVQEGASENLIAQLNRRADREVTVQLDTSDGSASGK